VYVVLGGVKTVVIGIKIAGNGVNTVENGVK
jgi:hypothetical protein